MYRPAIYRNGLFDDLFDFAFPEVRPTAPTKHDCQCRGLMKTDVKEDETGYTVKMDVPGFAKDDVQISLEKGTLTISASKKSEKEEKDEKKGFVMKERYSGSMSRSFYVGDELKSEDIHAKMEDGVLTLFVPRKEEKKEETKQLVTID